MNYINGSFVENGIKFPDPASYMPMGSTRLSKLPKHKAKQDRTDTASDLAEEARDVRENLRHDTKADTKK